MLDSVYQVVKSLNKASLTVSFHINTPECWCSSSFPRILFHRWTVCWLWRRYPPQALHVVWPELSGQPPTVLVSPAGETRLSRSRTPLPPGGTGQGRDTAPRWVSVHGCRGECERASGGPPCQRCLCTTGHNYPPSPQSASSPEIRKNEDKQTVIIWVRYGKIQHSSNE